VELQDTDEPPGGRVAVTAWHGPLPISGSVPGSCRIQVGNVIGPAMAMSLSGEHGWIVEEVVKDTL